LVRHRALKLTKLRRIDMLRVAVFLLILAIGLGMAWYAPRYLAYADKPVKSDVIVLFVGPDLNARKKEALKLIEEGYARRIIVPNYGIMISNPNGDAHQFDELNKPKKPETRFFSYPKCFEGTHVEVLEAKKIMDKAGFRSAVFVSSPFHMKRIKIMGGSIFGNSNFNVQCVPTRYEKKVDGFWLLSKSTIRNVTRSLSEYSP
jgi:hypothetical protein